MKKLFLATGCFLLLLPAVAQFNSIPLNGKDVYINGVNIPWNNFGWDFGEHEEWGEGYDSAWFDVTFHKLADNGVNCIRIWIHCDGRANPNFDESGAVTGLDAHFLDQLQEMIELADRHALMVILTLWSHDMLEDYTDHAGRFAGLHQDLIQDRSKGRSYVQHALIPMVKRVNQQCNILAWEIINEPEWGMNVGLGWETKQTVTPEEMQYFVGICVEAIRAYSNQLITIGSAKPMGNSDYGHTNYWHESAFHKLGFDCATVYFDFYCFHFYNYMGKDESPFLKDARAWELSKPILIAETPSSIKNTNKHFAPKEQIALTRENGYAGILFWSYHAGDEYSDWENCRQDLKDFYEAHEDDLAYSRQCDAISPPTPSLLVCKAYPNPAVDYINLNLHVDSGLYVMKGKMFNPAGKLVKSFSIHDDNFQLQLNDLAPGFYYLSVDIFNQNEELLQTWSEKIMLLRNG